MLLARELCLWPFQPLVSRSQLVLNKGFARHLAAETSISRVHVNRVWMHIRSQNMGGRQRIYALISADSWSAFTNSWHRVLCSTLLLCSLDKLAEMNKVQINFHQIDTPGNFCSKKREIRINKFKFRPKIGTCPRFPFLPEAFLFVSHFPSKIHWPLKSPLWFI